MVRVLAARSTLKFFFSLNSLTISSMLWSRNENFWFFSKSLILAMKIAPLTSLGSLMTFTLNLKTFLSLQTDTETLSLSRMIVCLSDFSFETFETFIVYINYIYLFLDSQKDRKEIWWTFQKTCVQWMQTNNFLSQKTTKEKREFRTFNIFRILFISKSIFLQWKKIS